MSAINISGKVCHAPYPQGANVPCANAVVQVFDIDAPGRGDDLIWTGTTNSNGLFSGQSSEWQDMVNLRYWTPRGWRDRDVPDVTDILSLKVRVTQGAQSKEFFPFVNQSPIPLFVPWRPPPPVPVQKRSLVVVNCVVGRGPGEYKWLYQFLQTSGQSVASQLLGGVYGRISHVNGEQATLNRFVKVLKSEAAHPEVDRIDVITNIHGGDGVMFFADADGIPVKDVKSAITSSIDLTSRKKFRMVYDTSCYGGSHAQALLDSGFKVTCGSKKVNANSSVEYPVVLRMWADDSKFSAAVAAGENPATRQAADAVARQMRFTDVDSDKDIFGDGSIWIGC